jgi:transposase-like protein
MSTNRRKFSKDFKAKVVLEALKEHQTIESLAKKHELQPKQISVWKGIALSNLSLVFSKENSNEKEKQEVVDVEKLYAQIGQLKVENDFLKKKLQ